MYDEMLGELTADEARLRYVEGGVSSYELAAAAGVSQGEAKRRLTEWGVFRTYASDKLSPQSLRRQVAAGASAKEIADAVGVTETTVQGHIARLELDQQDPGEAILGSGTVPGGSVLDADVIENLLIDRCLDSRGASRELRMMVTRFEAAVRSHGLSNLLTPKAGGVRLTEEQLGRYKRGASLGQLGREEGMSGRAVARCLTHQGVQLRGDDAARSGAQQPKADRDWLVREYHERGRTLADIGAELGVTESRVHQLFTQYGLQTGRRREEVPAEELRFLVGKGISSAAIAERLGVRVGTVVDEVRRLGLRRPRAYEKSGLTKELLEELYLEHGKSMGRIGQELEIPLGQIKAAFDDFGVPRRPRSETLSRGLETVLTREYLEREYVESGRTVAEIAREADACTATVEAYLVRTGLKDPRGLDERFDEALSQNVLRRLYLDEGRTITEVAAGTGAPTAEVRQRLMAYGIPIRTSARNTRLDQLPTEASVRSACEAPRNESVSELLDREFLREVYEVDGLASGEIAELADCEVEDVIRALADGGISIRLGLADILSEPFIRRRYVEQHASASQIARELGVSPSTLASWMERYGIDTRPRGLIGGRPRHEVLTREFLQDQCVRLDRSAGEVARELGTTPVVVLAALRAHGLPVKPARGGPGAALQYQDVLTRLFLEREYVHRGRSMNDIAASVGTTVSTVRRYLESHGLAVRTSVQGAG